MCEISVLQLPRAVLAWWKSFLNNKIRMMLLGICNVTFLHIVPSPSHHLESGLDAAQRARPYGFPQIGAIGILVTGNDATYDEHRGVI